MTFLDLFAGIGGFRNGLEQSGHKCVGHVEIDPYANHSYQAMYDLKTCKFRLDVSQNFCRMCRGEVNENCDGQNCNGEWYAKDIERIGAGEIPNAEIWTFGFPCVDVSIAGRMAGIRGKRSGLFFTVIGLLKGKNPENRPKRLIIENVKHLVASESGGAFTTVLFELWQAGYDCEWQIINSKNFHVPHHRERVYLVGYLRGQRTGKIFPIGGTNEVPIRQLIGGRQGRHVYDSSGIGVTLMSGYGGFGGRTGLYAPARFDAECFRSEIAGVYVYVCCGKPDEARAILSPDRLHNRQNGRRMKDCGEPSFTLTAQDRPGVFICCNTFCTEFSGCSICRRIRRLTPRECFRLQAFSDELFDRAQAAGISDHQLYRQAGNAVTVSVVAAIGQKLYQWEKEEFQK